MCEAVHIIEEKHQFFGSHTYHRKKYIWYNIFCSGFVLIGSGPKGRGFESRHFDQLENPGSVRLPGHFLIPAKCGKFVENRELLGETFGRKNRRSLYTNEIRLGELGEILIIVIIES